MALEEYRYDAESAEFDRFLRRTVLHINAARGGWVYLRDTQYEDSAFFTIEADTAYKIPMNAGIAERRWSNGLRFYDEAEGKLLGELGEVYLLTIQMDVEPQSNAATYIDIFARTGNDGAIRWRRTTEFAKGTGDSHHITYTTDVFFIEPAAADGVEFFVRSNGPVDIENIEFEISVLFLPVNAVDGNL